MQNDAKAKDLQLYCAWLVLICTYIRQPYGVQYLKMAEQMEDVGMTTTAAQEQELLAGIQPS